MFSSHNLFSQIVNLGSSIINKLIQQYISLSSRVHTLVSLQVERLKTRAQSCPFFPQMESSSFLSAGVVVRTVVATLILCIQNNL